MTVAVLNPQGSPQENRFTRFSNQAVISSPQMKLPKNANPTFKNRIQSSRRKRSPLPPRPQNTSHSVAAAWPKVPSKNRLVMGQVKILKRGEELTSTAAYQAPSEIEKKAIEKRDVPDLGSTERLGPDPQSVPKIRLTESENRVASFYAGSAFITSPPPSSLPLPAFFTKKSVSVSVTVKREDATSDLRRILKLDLL